MKTPIKGSVEQFGLTCLLLVAAIFWITGCSAPKPPSDPLAGWRELVKESDKPNQAITDDFHRYIQSLQAKERESATYVHYYEDGEGQHALRFEVPINGADWAHVLIYNKENKRIKAIKYFKGHYRS